jgi:hypothetical protein
MSTQPTVPNTNPPADSNADMQFDSAPVAQALTVPSPVNGPASSPSGDDGMTFDAQPTKTAITVPATSPAPVAPTPARPYEVGTAYATPEPSGLAEKAERWAANVQADLLHGTDLTGVGAILKGMGAHGFESGVSKETANLIGSLPLGLARAGQGVAELPQSGKRWAGTKNTVGGLLGAGQLPGMVVAPESAELGAGLEAVGEQGSKAATAIQDAVSTKNIQPALQQAMRNVLADVAKEAGVQPSDATSIRDVAESVSSAIKDKATGLYRQLDQATGGRVQRFDDALDNISRGIKEAAGIDPDTETALLQRQQEVQTAREAALQTAKAAGLSDPDGLIDSANAYYRQAMSLSDLSRGIRMSTEGIPADLAKAGSKATESVNVTKLLPRLNRLTDTGRLESAMGVDRLKSLYNAVQTSQEASEAVATLQKYAKWAAGIGLGGVAAGGVFNSVKHLFD